MKRKVENWSVEKLEKERNRITFPEYQREKSLWPDSKKSMLIDSILRGIDVPKLYFNQLRDKNKTIEVVDGQQRLWSIWEFLDEQYKYEGEQEKQLFSQLSAEQRKAIKNYEFQVTIFDEADEEYLRELFVRLQLGLLLNTGEKLHAEIGKMKDLVFDEFAQHRFVTELGIPTRRFAKQTLCAQISINSFSYEKNGVFARTRYEDLTYFFREYADPKGKDLEIFRKKSKQIPQVLDQLYDCFGDKTKELRNRSYILSIYLFVEEQGLKTADHKLFTAFIFLLWRRLREEAGLGIDRKNRELYSFQSYLSSAPGEEYQITRRHDKLKEYFAHYRQKKKIMGDR